MQVCVCTVGVGAAGVFAESVCDAGVCAASWITSNSTTSLHSIHFCSSPSPYPSLFLCPRSLSSIYQCLPPFMFSFRFSPFLYLSLHISHCSFFYLFISVSPPLLLLLKHLSTK